jgi:hypothetical protein
MSTSWVPPEIEQSDLTKAQRDGFLVGGDQVIFPSTKRIPKPPDGAVLMWVILLLQSSVTVCGDLAYHCMCSMQVVNITPMKHRLTSITSIRVVQQKHRRSKVGA